MLLFSGLCCHQDITGTLFTKPCRLRVLVNEHVLSMTYRSICTPTSFCCFPTPFCCVLTPFCLVPVFSAATPSSSYLSRAAHSASQACADSVRSIYGLCTGYELRGIIISTCESFIGLSKRASLESLPPERLKFTLYEMLTPILVS